MSQAITTIVVRSHVISPPALIVTAPVSLSILFSVKGIPLLSFSHCLCILLNNTVFKKPPFKLQSHAARAMTKLPQQPPRFPQHPPFYTADLPFLSPRSMTETWTMMASEGAHLKRSPSPGEQGEGSEHQGRQRSRAACAPCRQRKRKWYVRAASFPVSAGARSAVSVQC